METELHHALNTVLGEVREIGNLVKGSKSPEAAVTKHDLEQMEKRIIQAPVEDMEALAKVSKSIKELKVIVESIAVNLPPKSGG